MSRTTVRTRASASVRVGPFRLRLSAPLNGHGRVWGSAGTRGPLGTWLSLSGALSGKRGRGRG